MTEIKDKEHLRDVCEFAGMTYSEFYKVRKIANMFKAKKIKIDLKDKK